MTGEIVAATLTLFEADGSLDEAGMRRYLKWIASTGIDAVFLGGTTGEFTSLTTPERLRVFRLAADLALPVKMIAHVGAATTVEACVLASQAHEAGFGKLAACAPFGSGGDPDELVRHFDAIARQAPGAELFAYVFDTLTGTPMPPETLEELADKTRLAGAKISGLLLDDIVGYLGRLPGRFRVYQGYDGELPDALSGELEGIVSGHAAVLPEPFVEVRNALIAGDRTVAAEASTRATDVARTIQGDIALLKTILRERLDTGTRTRASLSPSADARSQARHIARAYGTPIPAGSVGRLPSPQSPPIRKP